jgi:protein disulfide-isomerase-like protein
MRDILAAIAILLLQCFSSAKDSSVTLTKTNFDEVTKGKTVFIKFFAPWCGHCQELAPAWEQMAAEWVRHENGLVAQVDCTSDQDLCNDFDIQGLPTLLYGDPSESGAYLHEYRESKSYEALSKFAKDVIAAPMCSPANLDPCESEMRAQIEDVLALSEAELEEAIARKEQEIETAEKEFAEEFQKMQTRYDELAAENQTKEARIKANIKMIKAVQQAQEQQ